MQIDISQLKQWIGRRDTFTDWIGPAPVRALAATLDRDDSAPFSGDEVPPCWHWLYFLPTALQSRLGRDGHPERGGYLPPVPLPRRMWAGSKLRWHGPLEIGQSYTRTSTIAGVELKAGRRGPLVFVKVHHEIAGVAGAVLTEDQDIVYRDLPRVGEAAPAGEKAPSDCLWSRHLAADPVLLFRYSALTFNAHRIHYDRPYAQGEEAYPGLVVQGPLLATLLIDLVRREMPGQRIATFRFLALQPTFDTDSFTLCGNRTADCAIDLWVRRDDGALSMKARAELA